MLDEPIEGIIALLQVSCEPCEDEWTFVARVHSCYLAPHHPLTWLGAEEYCQRAGANLVSVNSMKESHYVRLLADQHNPQFLTWIGLAREANTTEAPFRWSDGSDVTYTFFREGEPSSFGNCVALSSSEDANGWMTIDCDYSQFFLCEKRASGLEPIVLTSDSGEFYSPGYPGSYPDGVSVNYYIELPPESRVVITIEQLETEQSHDFLLILDHSEESQTLAMPCGSSEPVRLFRSESDSVFVVFVTEDSFDLSRWRFTYDCVRKDGFGDEVLIPPSEDDVAVLRTELVHAQKLMDEISQQKDVEISEHLNSIRMLNMEREKQRCVMENLQKQLLDTGSHSKEYD
ncbi:lectin C-type domain protein [Teladorsagia circumcincta]|uniref:Lectin C-type domain protein n=1 Tax=Teladorsagia circumcincta TaxID=45464 RepID=A0A2G9UHS3_TELCI|nr:lectin C-type domain protein [Teladorsagia circumcincta]